MQTAMLIGIGALVGGLIGWLGVRGESSAARSSAAEAKQREERTAAELAAKQVELTGLKEKCAGMEARIAEREASLVIERGQFDAVKDALKAEFAVLSGTALKDNGEAFLRMAKGVLATQHTKADGDLSKRQKEIENLVKPIQDGIKAVADAAQAMEVKRAEAFGSIEEQLTQSVQAAGEVAKQAGALKDALKRPTVRGRWGEVQLEICVELAGMEEHCDVEFQETSLSAEDQVLRPDMIVRMPGGRRVAVDSKVPMDHFLRYIEASTDDDRSSALLNHGRSTKKHVTDLAKKDYMQKIAESPDFVVMFLPNESFLAMALEKEPALMEEALKKKILVATPGTLIGLLKVIRYGWNERQMAQNAQRIADEGSKLNGEIVKFLAEFVTVGLAIEAASNAFGASKRRVENQIAKSSLSLTDLGAKNKSSLPKTTNKKVLREVTEILKAAGADSDDIEQIENPEQLTLAAEADEEESDR